MRILFVIFLCLPVPFGAAQPEAARGKVAQEMYDYVSEYAGSIQANRLVGLCVSTRVRAPLDRELDAGTAELAAAELRRRPGVAEALVKQAEENPDDNYRNAAAFMALRDLLKPTPDQHQTLMRLARRNWERYKAHAEHAERFTVEAAIEYLGAHPGKEAEALLIDMVQHLELPCLPAMVLAESGSAEGLPVLLTKLEEARAQHVREPDESGSKHYGDAVALLQQRIRSGQAPASWSGESGPPDNGRDRVTAVPARELEARSFWREPFVWWSAALLLGAGGVVCWRKIASG